MLTAIWLLSLLLSVASVLVMVALIIRRLRQQRRTRLDDLLRKRLVRELVIFTSESDADSLRPVLKTTAPRLSLDAGFEFLSLLRGEVHERIVGVFVQAGFPELIRHELAHGNETDRMHAAEMLSRLPPEHGAEALRRALEQDRAPEVRIAAAIALCDLDALPPLDVVLTRIGRRGQRSRRLIELFRKFPGERFRELETLVAGDGAPTLRAAALEALSRTGDQGLHDFFVAQARDPSPEVAAAAVRALGHVGRASSSEILEDAMRHGDWHIRACAAEAAGQLGSATLVEPLTALLDDASWNVRYSAGRALRAIAPAGQAVLSRIASGGSPRQQRTAALILSEGW